MYIREIPWLEPVEAAERLRPFGGLSFLDSAMRHDQLGRYSYVAADPFGKLAVRDGVVHWNDEASQLPPLEALSYYLDLYRLEDQPDLPPFHGGAIGYFSYEFGRLLENLPEPVKQPQGDVPDAVWSFYDVVLAFDHLKQKVWLVSSGLPEQAGEQRTARAVERSDAFFAALEKQLGQHSSPRPRIAREVWQSNFEREAYMRAVAGVVEYILDGDIFQANIAQRFSADLPDDYPVWSFYKALRQRNAATFAAYLEHDDLVIASSSPERFLSVRGRNVETRPIKGTVPRSADPDIDRQHADELLASEKDRAENLMIVDLMRNDLSRVCNPHSVLTPVLCGLESYASVHHLVSVVTGRLADDRTLPDLIRAAFPGGSITGAPKLRAMEIITETEHVARGIYCGSIGFIGFNGNMDTNIAIRTVLFQGAKAVFQAGGGITALSDPAAEYQETLDKAVRIFDVFDMAGDIGS
ncbi:aminodeoxychorismate synthase component I [Phyllobacterium sp. P30BS-XVII]|uniref:aminodeoxychorismate synthase component I n=1 Tax=Phyllobacterium sp. P30BS-XVII TaxID=2587046 RepID=UPI0015FB24D6|nr:aminodeoxychorismate synthase component I [Phyllobacterium sp. P30BS-XVII]MBA8902777.1 para-aminobenzoate synthetase component 1 [Phyllobacterium sp. P30BS-XVII]